MLPVQEKTVLLAFDLDKTLLITNISFLLGKKLYKLQYLSSFKVCFFLIIWVFHKFGLISTIQLHKNIFSLIFKGKQKSFIETIMNLDTPNIVSLLRTSLMKEIQERKSKDNHITVAILSTSPDFLVAPVAEAIHATWWKASTYHVDEKGVFDQITDVITGEKKADIIRCWRKKREKSVVYAYSDSVQDMPMLQEATYPVCVEPTILLRFIAIMKKWRIIQS